MDWIAPRISIVGCGSFGKLLLDNLSRFLEVTAFDLDRGVLRRLNYAAALDWASAGRADIIILAVPVQSLEAALIAIAPHVRPGCVVVDVCSVKLRPIASMIRLLPQHCEIVGTHPLFGPQSAMRGLWGSPVAIVPVRGNAWKRMAAFLRKRLGLKIIRTSAERHDGDMAYVQGLTHLLARVAGQMSLPDTPLSTRTYDHLRLMMGLVGQDSDALFEAIMTENPYAAAVFDEFVCVFDRLRARVHDFKTVQINNIARPE